MSATPRATPANQIAPATRSAPSARPPSTPGRHPAPVDAATATAEASTTAAAAASTSDSFDEDEVVVETMPPAKRRKHEPTGAAVQLENAFSEPCPARGTPTSTTVYMWCPLCPAKFGKKVRVSLTYMPTHMAKYHPGKRKDAPEDTRAPMAQYRKRCREKKAIRDAAPPNLPATLTPRSSVALRNREDHVSVEDDGQCPPDSGAVGQALALGQVSHARAVPVRGCCTCT